MRLGRAYGSGRLDHPAGSGGRPVLSWPDDLPFGRDRLGRPRDRCGWRLAGPLRSRSGLWRRPPGGWCLDVGRRCGAGRCRPGRRTLRRSRSSGWGRMGGGWPGRDRRSRRALARRCSWCLGLTGCWPARRLRRPGARGRTHLRRGRRSWAAWRDGSRGAGRGLRRLRRSDLGRGRLGGGLLGRWRDRGSGRRRTRRGGLLLLRGSRGGNFSGRGRGWRRLLDLGWRRWRLSRFGRRGSWRGGCRRRALGGRGRSRLCRSFLHLGGRGARRRGHVPAGLGRRGLLRRGWSGGRLARLRLGWRGCSFLVPSGGGRCRSGCAGRGRSRPPRGALLRLGCLGGHGLLGGSRCSGLRLGGGRGRRRGIARLRRFRPGLGPDSRLGLGALPGLGFADLRGLGPGRSRLLALDGAGLGRLTLCLGPGGSSDLSALLSLGFADLRSRGCGRRPNLSGLLGRGSASVRPPLGLRLNSSLSLRRLLGRECASLHLTLRVGPDSSLGRGGLASVRRLRYCRRLGLSGLLHGRLSPGCRLDLSCLLGGGSRTHTLRLAPGGRIDLSCLPGRSGFLSLGGARLRLGERLRRGRPVGRCPRGGLRGLRLLRGRWCRSSWGPARGHLVGCTVRPGASRGRRRLGEQVGHARRALALPGRGRVRLCCLLRNPWYWPRAGLARRGWRGCRSGP